MILNFTLAVTIFMQAAHASDRHEVSIERLVADLTQRRVSLSRFALEGHSARAIVDAGAGQRVGDAFSRSGGTIRREDVEQFLGAFIEAVPHRECFRYSLWGSESCLVVDRVRDTFRDNSIEWLSSRQLPGQILQPPTLSERIYLEGSNELLVQDRRLVSRIVQHTRDSVLRSVELSLVDWSPLLLDERHPAGQRRWVEVSMDFPGIERLVYESDGKAGALRTTYSFDRFHGMRPLAVRMSRGGSTVMSIDYFYDPSEQAGLPVALLRRSVESNGSEETVEAYVFPSAMTGAAVVIPERRIPAIRLELEQDVTGQSLVLTQVLPKSIDELAPEQRLAAAIAAIVDRWGSIEPEFDLDGDGVIGAGDLDRANDTL